MLFGPIVSAELVRVARQRRWYVLRCVLGMGLLLLIYQAYEWFAVGYYGGRAELSEREMSFLAGRILMQIMIGQSVAILILTPILVAGAIAEEKQRKTLHYLLSSRLSSLEIVGGKLAARFFLVLIPVAIVVPILVMLSFFGGVDVPLLLFVYAATFTTALFEASLAILVSTMARRGRDALLMTILLGLAWFFVPTLAAEFFDTSPRWTDFYGRWIEPINGHLLALSPLSVSLGARNPTAASALVMKMMAHQVVGSLILLALATWQLRPASRRQEGGSSRMVSAGRLLRKMRYRWRARPICGNDPMLWKETHGMAGSTLAGLVSVVSVVTIVMIFYEPIREIFPAAWRELTTHGYRVGREYGARQQLSTAVRGAATGFFTIGALLLMVQAATSISREREDDTWVSLVATPLSGWEILRAKLAGSLWSTRHMAYAILPVWALGLATATLHPLGLLIASVQLVAFGLCIVAAGTLISMTSRTTMRAIGLGVFLLVWFSLLMPIILAMFAGGRIALPVASSPPFLFAVGMLNYGDVQTLIHPALWPTEPYSRQGFLELIRAEVGGTVAFLALGPVLLSVAARQFDRLLDRPRRRTSAIPEDAPRPSANKPEVPAGAGRAGLPAGRA